MQGDYSVCKAIVVSKEDASYMSSNSFVVNNKNGKAVLVTVVIMKRKLEAVSYAELGGDFDTLYGMLREMPPMGGSQAKQVQMICLEHAPSMKILNLLSTELLDVVDGKTAKKLRGRMIDVLANVIG